MLASHTNPEREKVLPTNDQSANDQSANFRNVSRAGREHRHMPTITAAFLLTSVLAASAWVNAQTQGSAAATQATQPKAVTGSQPGQTTTPTQTQAAATQPSGRSSKAANTQAPLGPPFSSLTPYQAEVLKPLQPVWDEMGDIRKRKWIEIANRLPTLSDDEKNRVTQRMQEWASLTPEQRKQARDNFSEAMGKSSAERQAQWEEYQKLSPEARQALIERAQQELKQRREAAVASSKGPVGAAATTRPATRPATRPTTTLPAPTGGASASQADPTSAAPANPASSPSGQTPPPGSSTINAETK